MSTDAPSRKNFIRDIIDADLASGKHTRIVTRFPPEPNGYLHIGHAKSICLNFGLARDYADLAPDGAMCNLRFDDTNPSKEAQEYIDSIQEDIRWLGFTWSGASRHASDYFEQLYDWAEQLIRKGCAYVCDLSGDEIARMRGTLTRPGENSPYRDRAVEENLDLFRRMRAGEFANGDKVLRAKIDMTSPNINLRDPVLYRVMHHTHPRTGDAWCIYPMYDWAHGQSDAIEEITHSLCTLEFEDHRPLYNWFLEQLDLPHKPRQIEFGRLNLTHTVMSKRKFLALVQEGHVRGWDDPRMPTLSGLRRRGYPPEAIREFCDGVGIAKRENTIELSRLEHHVREHLNRTALRRMAVLDPIRVVITNYPEDQTEQMELVNNPEDAAAGVRHVPFSRELFIERDDFMPDPPPKYFRLTPGREVRLRGAYWIRAESYDTDDEGRVTEVRCTYDPETRGGSNPPDGRKVKGTIHWVSARHAIDAEMRLYDVLFSPEDPSDLPEGVDWRTTLNSDSLRIVDAAKLEPALAEVSPDERIQFERVGYFCCDPDTSADRLVFNRTVTLKDAWSRMQKRDG